MKLLTRHTIILFALLISFFQSAHIFSHACIEHDENTKELIQFTDHKCNLCTNQVQFTIPDSDFEFFSFDDVITKQTPFSLNEFCSSNHSILYRQLRAPPIFDKA